DFAFPSGQPGFSAQPSADELLETMKHVQSQRVQYRLVGFTFVQVAGSPPNPANHSPRTRKLDDGSLGHPEVSWSSRDLSPMRFGLGIVGRILPVEGQNCAAAMPDHGISLKEILSGIKVTPFGRNLPRHAHVFDAFSRARQKDDTEIFGTDL